MKLAENHVSKNNGMLMTHKNIKAISPCNVIITPKQFDNINSELPRFIISLLLIKAVLTQKKMAIGKNACQIKSAIPALKLTSFSVLKACAQNIANTRAIRIDAT